MSEGANHLSSVDLLMDRIFPSVSLLARCAVSFSLSASLLRPSLSGATAASRMAIRMSAITPESRAASSSEKNCFMACSLSKRLSRPDVDLMGRAG